LNQTEYFYKKWLEFLCLSTTNLMKNLFSIPDLDKHFFFKQIVLLEHTLSNFTFSTNKVQYNITTESTWNNCCCI